MNCNSSSTARARPAFRGGIGSGPTGWRNLWHHSATDVDLVASTFPRLFNIATASSRYSLYAKMARRQHLTLTVVLGFVIFLSLTYFFGSSSSTNLQRGSYVHGAAPDAKVAPDSIKGGHDKANVEAPRDSKADSGFTVDFDNLPSLDGDSIAPKLENATLKSVSLSFKPV